MTELACILAAPDLALEPVLVAQSSGFGLQIVRRSLDAADLMAAAALEPQLAIVVTAGLPRLTRDLIARICLDRLVLGLATDARSAEQLLSWGVSAVVDVSSVGQTLADLCSALSGAPRVRGRAGQQGVWSTGAWAPIPPAQFMPDARPLSVAARGGVVAVWGGPGSPGRTSATLMLGQLFAGRGRSVCLIDADTSAPSLLQVLGVAENASSLVVACRFAERDSLTAPRLMQTAHTIDERMAVLGGVSHPEQWGDVRPAALAAVVEACRSSFDLTFIDVGSGLERELHADLLSTRRFEAANSAVAACDALVAIAQATPLGITRLLQHLPSAGNASVPSVAVAVAPASRKGSASAGARSLRDYGMQLPIFALPRYSTQDLVQVRMRPGVTRRKFGRGSDLAALQTWIEGAVANASRGYGDGSTTTAVPTRANL